MKIRTGLIPFHENSPKLSQPRKSPFEMPAKLSVGNEMGLPFDHHRDRPRADTIMPSVAMKGGMRV